MRIRLNGEVTPSQTIANYHYGSRKLTYIDMKNIVTTILYETSVSVKISIKTYSSAMAQTHLQGK